MISKIIYLCVYFIFGHHFLPHTCCFIYRK